MGDEPHDTPAEPDAASAGPAAATAPAPKPVNRRWWSIFTRHKALTAVALVLVLLATTAGGYLWWANDQIGKIPRIDAGITPHPEKDHNESEYALNILLLGADHGNVGLSVAEDMADGKWTPWEHLSDTIMVVHIPAGRESAQLVSIPRDSWVEIEDYPYDNGHGKINAAFSYGGPALAVKTVENLTGLTIDHVAIIDWAGFRDLTSAVGGVAVYIPETFTDTSQNVTWTKGWETIEGERALQYVRTRYDIPGDKESDFGRMARQQNFLRALMGKLLSTSTTRNPIRFGKVLTTLTRYLTVDETWDNDEIRGLALAMRDLEAEHVQFVTAPFGSFDEVSGQSIVRLDPVQTRSLFRSIERGKIAGYLERHPDEGLADDTQVN